MLGGLSVRFRAALVRTIWSVASLVHPLGGVVLPLDELIVREPESNLLLGALDGVRSMDDVSANINAEIATDGAWFGVRWLGGTEHLASGSDGVVTFPDHGDDWARGGVVHESCEEWLA